MPTVAIGGVGAVNAKEIMRRTGPTLDAGNSGASIQKDPTGRLWVVWACDYEEAFMSIVENVEGLVLDGTIALMDVAFHSPRT